MAKVFTDRGLKAKAVKSGPEYIPNIYARLSEKNITLWLEAFAASKKLIEKYRALKKSKSSFALSAMVRQYAIEAFRANSRFGGGGNPKRVWQRFSPEEQLYVIIDEGMANEDGTPTKGAIDAGARFAS